MNLCVSSHRVTDTTRKDLRVVEEAIKYIEIISHNARIYARAVSERAHEDVPDPQRVLAGLRKVRDRLSRER